MLLIDLHGFSVQQTKTAITNVFHKAFEQNAESIYVITGRGNHVNANGTSGVLKKLLPSLLEPYAEKIECMDTESGAYKITLKQAPSLKKKFIDQLAKTDLFDSFQAELEQEAKNNNADAMIQLACLYLSFSSTDKDKIKVAFQMLHHLESINNATAGIVLAEIYLDGLCTKREPKKGFNLLKKHAKQSQIARFNLAKCYLLGEGIKRDDATGAKLMKELAGENYPPACGNLGRSYLQGDFTEINLQLAFKNLKEAADQEYSLIYVDLARCYGSGEGVKQSDHMALHYYQKASQLNNPYAFHQLGNYHLYGRGVVADSEKAFGYFLQAAKLGDTDSEAIVGILYFRGQGVAQNFTEGIVWLTKAANKNNVNACFNLGEILLCGVITTQDIPLARKYLRVAIKNNYPYAMFSLALAILKLPHSAQEKEEAFNLLKKSLMLKNSQTNYIGDPSWAGQHFILSQVFFNPPKNLITGTSEMDLFFSSLTMLSTGFMQRKMYNPVLSLEIAEYAAKKGDVAAQAYLLMLCANMQQPNNTPTQTIQNTPSISSPQQAIDTEQQKNALPPPKSEEATPQNTRKPYLSMYATTAIGIVIAAVASTTLYQYRK